MNKYERFYNNKRYVDGETGERLLVDNVIVQYVEYDWHEGKSDRPKVTTTGENKCEHFIGGKHFTVSWKRERLHKNTVYYDANGTAVKHNPGKTFIQVLRTERQSEIMA